MHASAPALKALDAVYHSAINGDPSSTHHCTSSKNVGCSSLAERSTMDFLFMYTALSRRIACVHYIPASSVHIRHGLMTLSSLSLYWSLH